LKYRKSGGALVLFGWHQQAVGAQEIRGMVLLPQGESRWAEAIAL